MKKLTLVLIIAVVSATCAIGVSGITASAWDTTIDDWGLEYFSELDYGIYWYTANDNVVPTEEYTVNKNAPTMIFTHGWKPNGESKMREDLSIKGRTDSALASNGYEPYPYDKRFYNYYLQQGYNVGVFYWQQFADEGLSLSVDSKIWSHNTEEKGMAYVTYDENGKGTLTKPDDETNPDKSVAVLYGEEIIKWLGNDYSGELHLAGHSMGGQLTLAVSEYLCLLNDKGTIKDNLLPDRVTILDPYLSNTKITGTVTHKGEKVKDVTCAQLASYATETIYQHGIPIEGYGVNLGMCFRMYATPVMSPLTNKEIQEVHETLAKNCAWIYLEGLATGKFSGFSPSHVMSVDYYYTTNNFEVTSTSDGIKVPSARLSTDELKKLVGMTFLQTCPNNKNSLYQTDSTYERVDFVTFEKVEENVFVGFVTPDREKELTAILYDSKGKEVAEGEVDAFNRYVFGGLDKEESYTIKFFSNGLYVDEIKDITAESNGGYYEIPAKELIIGNDDILFYALIAILAVIALVVIVSIVSKIVSHAKKK